VTTWLSTFDSLLAKSQNYVVLLASGTRQFQFIPWDLDHSFGQFYPIGTQEQRENLSITSRGRSERFWNGYSRSTRSSAATGRLGGTGRHACRPERFASQVDELLTCSAPACRKNRRRNSPSSNRSWPVNRRDRRFRRWFWGWFRGWFRTLVKPIKAFVVTRAKSVW